MSQEDLECFSGLIFFQSDHYSVHEVDICFKWHLKAKAIGKGNVFSDGFENDFILLCNDDFRGHSKVPELNEQ